MKVKLLKKIRRLYSYLWVENVLSDYQYKNEEGVWKRLRTTELSLLVVNEHTKKTEYCITEKTPTLSIQEFLKNALGDFYYKLKNDKEKRRCYKNYDRFKKRQLQIKPKVLFINELILLHEHTNNETL